MSCLDWVKTTLLVVFFYCTHSYAGEVHSELHPNFPSTAIELQDGDVILNDGLGFISSFNKEFGYPIGPYTHVSVYIEFSGEDPIIVGYTDEGIQISSPGNVLHRNFRLALLRPIAKPPAGALASAFKQLSKQSLKFDYDMKLSKMNGNSTYCVDFVAQLFKLTDPLADGILSQSIERPSDFWSDWAQKHLGLDLSQIISPNALMLNPHFQLMAQYESEDMRAQVNKWIRESIMQKIKAFIRNDHLDIAPPNLGSRLALYAAKKGVLDDVALAKMPESRQKIFITVYEFMTTVESRVKRTMLLNDAHDWNEESVRVLTGEVSDALRDDFFIPEQAQR